MLFLSLKNNCTGIIIHNDGMALRYRKIVYQDQTLLKSVQVQEHENAIFLLLLLLFLCAVEEVMSLSTTCVANGQTPKIKSHFNSLFSCNFKLKMCFLGVETISTYQQQYYCMVL